MHFVTCGTDKGNIISNKRKHIDLIESIQRHFTRCVIGMKGLEYEDKLRALNLPSLEYRRLRDMIEKKSYKITHQL